MTSVTICIPTYNQAPFLEKAVRSAVVQTHPCEVWVSDDASTDNTPEIMARLLREFPQIKNIRHEQNLGLPGNPRWLVQQPRSEFIVRLDSDDELHPEYVENVLKAMQNHPSAGYGHAAVQEIGADGRERKLRLLGRSEVFQDCEKSLRASILGYRVAANICMFRRIALEQVNYYRTEVFCDDWDMAVRLADAGWGNVYINKVLARYRVWDTSENLRSRRKLSELEGCSRVIEESLIPAFTRRAWSLMPVNRSRRSLALAHAVCLRVPYFTKAEKGDLERALLKLGDSLRLRWKFCWIRTPLAPMFQFPRTLASQVKTLCKAALFRTSNLLR